MAKVLVATEAGCRVFNETNELACELEGYKVGPLAVDRDGTCLAIVGDTQVWRRSPEGRWSQLATADIEVQSLMLCGGSVYCGGMNEAAILRISGDGRSERLGGFEHAPGRSQWFAGGPPLGVRSLAKTSDERVLFAGVHVGGILRSEDGGQSWTPTIPILFDVHEVRGHPSRPEIVAAATAVGLCVSNDQGRTWDKLEEGLHAASSLAVAVLEDEVLFSVQDGPFATRSQVWRWRLDTRSIEPVSDGLPEWLAGRVDTNQIAVGRKRAAIVDCGGQLWLADAGSSGWEHVAQGLPYAWGLAIL